MNIAKYKVCTYTVKYEHLILEHLIFDYHGSRACNDLGVFFDEVLSLSEQIVCDSLANGLSFVIRNCNNYTDKVSITLYSTIIRLKFELYRTKYLRIFFTQ